MLLYNGTLLHLTARLKTIFLQKRIIVVVVVVDASGKPRFPRVYESRHLHVFIKLSLSFEFFPVVTVNAFAFNSPSASV